MSVKMINCPDCGLALRVADDAAAFKFVYDMRDWQLGVCRSATPCGAFRSMDGMSPAQPRQCENKREGGEVRSLLQRSTPRDRRWLCALTSNRSRVCA